jgi:formamidopyrimidine-DNA glycosylase
MPELPEVEALRLGLVPRLVGATINKVSVLKPKIVSSKGTTRQENPIKVEEFETDLVGQKIVELSRRAKNIMIHLSGGGLLLVHLKMTGQLVFKPFESDEKVVIGGHPIQESEQILPNKHTYIIFELDNGTLFYNDVRQFGYVLYYPDLARLEDDKHFDELGMEPLSDGFEINNFIKALKSKSSPLKTVLLNQSVVVGCGNIYADEACFASGIKPDRKCDSLNKKEIIKLYVEIKRILNLAVEQGGSSIANYLLADGSRGNYADFHLVYGRKGKNCLVCGTLLESYKLAGRTTVFCPKCQK